MRPTLQDMVVERLRATPGEWFNTRDLAAWAIEAYPDRFAAKLAKTPRLKTRSDLIVQVGKEIAADRPRMMRKYPQIQVKGVRRQYCWRQ